MKNAMGNPSSIISHSPAESFVVGLAAPNSRNYTIVILRSVKKDEGQDAWTRNRRPDRTAPLAFSKQGGQTEQ